MLDYINDPRLSFKAKGLISVMLYLQSQQNTDSPLTLTSDKEITFNSAMNELRKYSYVSDVIEVKGGKEKAIGLVAFAYALDADPLKKSQS